MHWDLLPHPPFSSTWQSQKPVIYDLQKWRTHVTGYVHPGDAEDTPCTALSGRHVLHHLSADIYSPEASYLVPLPFRCVYPHFLRVTEKTDGGAQSCPEHTSASRWHLDASACSSNTASSVASIVYWSTPFLTFKKGKLLSLLIHLLRLVYFWRTLSGFRLFFSIIKCVAVMWRHSQWVPSQVWA